MITELNSQPVHSRIPVRDVFARVFHPPVRDPAFWIVQVMVLIWAFVHLESDLHGFLVGTVLPEGAPIDLLLIPIGYAALRYGLSGSAATALWAFMLWTPDFLLSDDRGHPQQDLVQLAIVVAVALFVGLEIERAHIERARAEAAEKERLLSALHYQMLFDQNASPILLTDQDGIVTEANPAAIALWREAVGTNAVNLIGIANDDLGRSSPAATVALRNGHDYRVSVSPLLSTEGQALHQVVLDDVTEEHRAESAARAWAGEVLRAQEEERRRIAREIHDDPLQRLIQLARRIEPLDSPAPEPASPEVTRCTGVRGARNELLAVVAQLRGVVHALRPAGLEQLGLVAAVRGMLADLEEHGPLAAELTVTGNVERGPAQTEVGAFRIVQEAVRNVVHHAHATVLSVQLRYGDDSVEIVVSDNGRGFHKDDFERDGGRQFGILGMRERASLLGGTFAVTSSPSCGTTVVANLPLQGVSKTEASAARAVSAV